jgi:UDPglucose--hexose-1-phosphate uridylyltransferase
MVKIQTSKTKKKLQSKIVKEKENALVKKKKTEMFAADQSSVSQLRQDIVTGDWVVIATGRGKRPDDFKVENEENCMEKSAEECIFCDPVASGQEKDVLIYNTSDEQWTLRVFPNKYPAFSKHSGGRLIKQEEGPYFWTEGIGYHELIVTRDHQAHIGIMDPVMVAEVIDAYQTRYLELMNKKSVRYIEIFHNHGKEAGASVSHPHSQLAAIPVISPYIKLEIDGAERYYRANKQCVYCTILEWEQEYQKRIVFENDDFIAFCPFASRAAFEIWVLPKKHQAYFERLTDEEKMTAGEALAQAVGAIVRALGVDVAYNFYIHTAPCDGADYPYYHWHIEILPKTSVWAGFELSTGIEVSTIMPEDAAEYLRKYITV